jgi:glycosyltransferase involved in cell wall biosynthesis
LVEDLAWPELETATAEGKEEVAVPETMKILLVANGFPPHNIGGVEVYTSNVATALKAAHKVRVLYPVHRDSVPIYECQVKERQGLQLAELNLAGFSPPPLWFRVLRPRLAYKDSSVDEVFERLLDGIEPDVVHFQYLGGLSASLVKTCKRRAIPTVLTLHDFWFMCARTHLWRSDETLCEGPDDTVNKCAACVMNAPDSQWNRIADTLDERTMTYALPLRLLSRLAKARYQVAVKERNTFLKGLLQSDVDIAIAPSQFLRQKFVAYGIPPSRIIHVSHGVDTKPFQDIRKPSSPTLRFGFIGGIIPIKGIDLAIEALAGLKTNRAVLKIYGGFFPEKLPYHKSLLDKSQNAHVEFMGSFNHSARAAVYADIDMLVVPSLVYESFSFVIHEAFAAKTPVLASDIGAMAEAVDHGQTGLLFRAGDVQDLRKKLRLVVQNPDMIEHFKRNIHPIKNIEEHAQELEAIYSRVVAGKWNAV